MDLAELRRAVKTYLASEDLNYSISELELYINAVKCFQQYDEIGEFSVEQILKRFVGKWNNRDAYIEEMLVEHGVEDALQLIELPSPIQNIGMFLECLNYDKIWEAMSQAESALKGYIWNDSDNKEADYRFYVYDITSENGR